MGLQWLSNRCFNTVHRKNLVYNTCWEDPQLDRQALALNSEDTVALITSAGCNALDYVLENPSAVHAVDVNPLQTALLDMKIACIRTLDYDDFFSLFGIGRHSSWANLYHGRVRQALPEAARTIWDTRTNFFDGSHRRRSFYFRGTSGLFAWCVNRYVNRHPQLRAAVTELLQAEDIDVQQRIYQRRDVDRLLWNRPMKFMLRRDTTMALLGVPRSQRKQIDRDYPTGIAGFIQDRISHVFRQTPLKNNYFWRVYLTGRYTKDCCPEYLREANFDRLKSGLIDRVTTHTASVEHFLRSHDQRITKFVLLDHMDWLYEHHPEALLSEWQAIIDRSADRSRILWRSAALRVDFIDPLSVNVNATKRPLGELLRYQTDLAATLHTQDRVHTYGSFYIADLDKAAA